MLNKLDDKNKQTTDPNFYLSTLHDMKTALTIVGGYVSLILDGDTGSINQEQRESLEIVQRSYRYLLELSNDIATLIRIQHGQWSVTRKTADLKKIILESMSSLKNQIQQKNIQIDFKIQDDQLLITSDVESLEKAFAYLLGTLVRLSEVSGKIGIQSFSRDDDWQIVVSDSIKNISLQDIQALFNGAYRMELKSETEEKDSGLGFLICKDLIELCDGKVWSETQAGAGNKYYVQIPKKKELARRKILIIEDNLVISKMWQNKLSKAEYDVYLSPNGSEGLQKAAEIKPDLVLLDVLMPGIDGFTVCQQLKANSELKKIPVVFLSNLMQSNLEEKAKEVGAIKFLNKSHISPTDLVEKIREIFEEIEAAKKKG
ncbi:MAG: hybrid sensor histidine kinase/response regulator [Firmicutes bacterium]|nr:hybrid sensor histidine kinase/response regulator [Bacillota bacterium]